MMDKEDSSGGYGKRPFWQWIAIYAVAGIVIYGLIYYFVLAKKGQNNYSVPSVTPAPATTPSASASATETKQNTITLSANGFSSEVLTVKAGTKVTWINQSGQEATVNSSPHPTHTDYPPLNLGNFPDGGILSLTFDKPGTYKYHNHLDSSQKGTIIVQ